ncbi:hypothetical protein LIER_41492 [Lithospermum erythrorhizon]|uniref:Uncharacterized protein n=1 Tax=Lithospermum erythrorhizon TaxID=34254 RepID=A0AAV3RC68_LITER
MKNLGKTKHILCMEIKRIRAQRLLWNEAGHLAMQKITYASTIESLMYAMICTRPDIAYDVSLMSKSNPGKKNWEGVKWILRHLRGNSRLCICYGSKKDNLIAYTDFDLAGDIDSMKSTSGYLFSYGEGAI